ncbi:MAG: tetratricopeptide repeat protein [Bryobacteraceae bacterium]|nr:tetratricopeptide repeat protein [Bryobacterales bacterium]MEB2361062.1 tetratricopeptide repeat protein [Bryobacterales bacterium]NUN01105.1 tetratricopeptide repeat protein [Bryobacteraceae bacterium]
MRRLALIAILVSQAEAAEWVRIATSAFEVYTDAGEETAREALSQIERIHSAFAPMRSRDLPLPARIIVFSSRSEFERTRPSSTAEAFFQSGPERDYIVAHRSVSGNYRVLRHEYVHLALSHSSSRLPLWFEEGTAEFYSTIDISGTRLRIGEPIPDHIRKLQSAGLLEAAVFAAVDRGSPWYSDRDKAGLFYAQCWALVHMMNLAPGYRGRMPVFADKLAAGDPPAQAFHEAFGKNLAAALADAAYYLRRPFRVAHVAWEPSQHEIQAQVERIGRTEAALVIGELLIYSGKPELAEEIYARVEKDGTGSPESVAGSAMIALRRGSTREAMRQFERAIALGSRQASVFFEYAMLLRDSRAEAERYRPLLEQAIAIQPSLAEAQFILGLEYSREGNEEKAVEHYRKAAEILPRQANFWHALALSYHKLGQRELALRCARRTLQAARNPAEMEMAEAAIRLTSNQQVEPERRSGVATPGSWQSSTGDSAIVGQLVRVDCEESEARLHLKTSAGDFILRATRNTRGDVRQLECGVQKPLNVSVGYDAATKEIRRIVFR